MKKQVSGRDLPGRIAILGAGNIGLSIARGLAASGRYRPQDITLTRRRVELLEPLKK
jgi:pyrroline-5-carboxylate reductase